MRPVPALLLLASLTFGCTSGDDKGDTDVADTDAAGGDTDVAVDDTDVTGGDTDVSDTDTCAGVVDECGVSSTHTHAPTFEWCKQRNEGDENGQGGGSFRAVRVRVYFTLLTCLCSSIQPYIT
jgi:hypothetical protein